MSKGRLEAFSDGVIAIIITIMVLEMKVPHGTDFAALQPLLPVFLSYVLSFVYVGIYWNNHHHLLQTTHRVNGAILWANLHLLFWLSLVPFGTGWMGENNFAPLPTAVYGVVLLCAALAYELLQYSIIKHHGRDHVQYVEMCGTRDGKITGLRTTVYAGLGAYASTVVLTLALGWTTATAVLLALLVVAATLEAGLGLCIGCKVFAGLMRAGVIPETVCVECADISGRLQRV